MVKHTLVKQHQLLLLLAVAVSQIVYHSDSFLLLGGEGRRLTSPFSEVSHACLVSQFNILSRNRRKSKITRTRRTNLFSPAFEILLTPKDPVILRRVSKIPLIRVIQNGELLDEFVVRDLAHLRGKLQELIAHHESGSKELLHESGSKVLHSDQQEKKPGTGPSSFLKVNNGAQAEQIVEESFEGQILVCKYGASWCRKCKYLDSPFKKIAEKCQDLSFLFLDIDIDGLVSAEERIGELSESDSSGPRQENFGDSSDEEKIKNCLRCDSTGFVECLECKSRGFVLRISGEHEVADICPVCVGYKKTRCPECGGKCLMCS